MYCSSLLSMSSTFFISFFNATPTTEIYPFSLHDALPIFGRRLRSRRGHRAGRLPRQRTAAGRRRRRQHRDLRSEEHTSELQSHVNLVCRLLLEKKKKQHNTLSNRHTQTPTTRPPAPPAPT